MEGLNMTNPHKIVVAVDESEESMHALSWCLSNLVSQNSDSTLVLLYVKPPPPIHTSYDAAGYMFCPDVIATMDKYGSNLIRIERVVGSGEAKDVICDTVEKLRADTLVMGSHGYGFLKRAILGSVSEYCAKRARCPVVIVKREK
ncbi:hypothetical protein Tsubulata_004255 [Turnera subulata]|uniref:UspA domain-containing protein n=1 Tax=Turnera subulata TaxID=218843 RepID=A0A9Q0FW31_9ROSI|nr:hypothetical protein Tsubulata_004255 [Turnera subulata]